MFVCTFPSSFWMIFFPPFRAICSASSSLLLISLIWASSPFFTLSRWSVCSCSRRSSSPTRASLQNRTSVSSVTDLVCINLLCASTWSHLMCFTSQVAFLALSVHPLISAWSSSCSCCTVWRSTSSFLLPLRADWNWTHIRKSVSVCGSG